MRQFPDIGMLSRPHNVNLEIRFLFCMPLAVADREVDPWVFSRKGKIGGSDVFTGERGRRHSPNISEIARKLVKIRPCCNRNGHGLFCDLFVCNSILLLVVVKTPPPQNWSN